VTLLDGFAAKQTGRHGQTLGEGQRKSVLVSESACGVAIYVVFYTFNRISI